MTIFIFLVHHLKRPNYGNGPKKFKSKSKEIVEQRTMYINFFPPSIFIVIRLCDGGLTNILASRLVADIAVDARLYGRLVLKDIIWLLELLVELHCNTH